MMPDTLMWIMAVLAMGAVTFAIRAAPAVMPKRWLKSNLLMALNFALPLCVMTLLVLSSLHVDAPSRSSYYLLAEILALSLVWLSYRLWRNVLVSMMVGVAALNGWLWLLANMP